MSWVQALVLIFAAFGVALAAAIMIALDGPVHAEQAEHEAHRRRSPQGPR